MAGRIAAASDHAGLALREVAIASAKAVGFEVEDLGPFSADSVDYPDQARRVAEEVIAGRATFGVLVCGTGVGMAIAANKLRGIRAANCTSEFEARMARAHNDANVLCLGERTLGSGLAAAIVTAFLQQPFEGGRHQRRIDKIRVMEG